MNTKEFKNVFPLGSHLCREPMPPMSELKKNMEILKKHGFNLVKLQEHWAIDEPKEGQYDFSKYEEIVEYAARLDMGVYLGLTCEQAPAWLWRKHPDCRMVGRNGLVVAYEAPTTMPADGKPGPCYDHPGAMADQLRFITELVERLGRYENLVVWNIWQEIAYWSDGFIGQSVCFCPHTLDYFRTWLQARYGDLKGLNRAWNTRYGEWQDVSPSRSEKAKGPYAVDIAWQYFMDNIQIGRILSERARVIKGADPLNRPVFAHMGGPIIGSGQGWTYARCQDFLGCSCYPAWASFDAWDDWYCTAPLDKHLTLLGEIWEGVALWYDYIRSCNPVGKPIWAAEFQGGPVSNGFYKGRVPSPDDIRRWMLTAVGSGVTAISFWVTRAEIMAAEANGFSLLDSEGDSTPRLEEASRVGAALNHHADLFGQPSQAQARVAILINEWNYKFCSSMTEGYKHLSYSVRGWHRFLWEAGIPVDFVEVSELDEDYVSGYKVFILPFPLSLSERVVQKLSDWVKRGGNLISEACPGRINEHAFCNRGELLPAARQLFGVRHESLTMVREPGGSNRWSRRKEVWGAYLDPTMLIGVGVCRGYKLRPNVYLETFTCQGSEPCFMFNDAVGGTVQRLDQGQAWLLGTFVGHSGTAYRNEESKKCVLGLLAKCGVFPEHSGNLLLRKRITKDKEAWIFFNATEDEVNECISVDGYSSVEYLLGEKTEYDGTYLILRLESLEVKVLILRK